MLDWVINNARTMLLIEFDVFVPLLDISSTCILQPSQSKFKYPIPHKLLLPVNVFPQTISNWMLLTHLFRLNSKCALAVGKSSTIPDKS